MAMIQSHHTIARHHRNRFLRISLSNHLWDLKIIATLAVMLSIPVICIWVMIWANSAANTSELDETTDMLYAATACLELHSAHIDDATVRLLSKARDDLATARSKVQSVNSYLSQHIHSPVASLRRRLHKLAATIDGSPPNFEQVFGDTCAEWKTELGDANIQIIKDQLPGLISTVKYLASALTSAETSISVWTLFGASLTALLAFGGWLYRTGDTRLTSIDVIASEIFSLCRAMANNQSMERLIKLYNCNVLAYSLAYIEIAEKYDDFMGGVGSSLGFLDQFTISRVTGFYTSLKIARDRFRMLKNWAIDASSKEPTIAGKNYDFLRSTIRQIAYDFFLCLENARIAIHLLLEEDGLHDDCIFVCLLSEIRVLSFLINLPNNSPYIQGRLEDRLAGPDYNTLEELESYLHPAYARAMQRVYETYQSFYVDGDGMDIVSRLQGSLLLTTNLRVVQAREPRTKV